MKIPWKRQPVAKPVATVKVEKSAHDHVHLIDTSVASDNIGDEIIVESARRHLDPLMASAYVTTSAGHDGLGPFGRPGVESADVVFLLGTNALAPFDQMSRRRFIWMIKPEDVEAYAGKVVLLGVGANRYFDAVDKSQAALLKSVLSPDHVHSVRDSLGLKILEDVGVEAVNTSCPTLWRFAGTSAQPRTEKASSVVFTLTKHKAGEADLGFVNMLLAHYDAVYFWPQQPRDLDYLASFADLSQINVLPPNLKAYDALLSTEDVDVIGTRLHGCIRGLHFGQRVLAIAIDNRASEIGRETGLPILQRDNVAERLPDLIEANTSISLDLPEPNITRFLDQFRSGFRARTT